MKTNSIKTKLFTVLLTLCMALSAVPITVSATTSTVSNETELIAALVNPDCTEIKLGENVEISAQLNIRHTVTLDLNGYTLTCSASDIQMIWVRRDGNLTVKDSGTGGTIDGQNKNSGIDITGSTLILESGTIANCMEKASGGNGDGSAVDIGKSNVNGQSKPGTFIMNGGTIKNCTAGDDGGAVDVGTGSTFVMNGGIIENCRAEDDGGAVIIKKDANFEMNGGLIQGCSTGGNGGAVYIDETGCFTMNGGTIKDCKRDIPGGNVGNAVDGINMTAVVVINGGTFENCGVWACTIDTFTVTFDSDGGSTVSEQNVRNAPAIKPSDPKKPGYDFVGWYLGENEYTFNTNVKENITLKAHWTTAAPPNTITQVNIESQFNYKAGDTPQKTADPFDEETKKYEIAYECWEEIENNNPIAFWYSDERQYTPSMKRITQFEEGKNYMYSIELRAKDGYTFADNCTVKINDRPQSVVTKTQNGLFILAIATIHPTSQKEIEVIEINNATLTFNDGDTPVFTGTITDTRFVMVYEAWQTDGEGISSDEWFNNDDHLDAWGGKLITTFDKNKIYAYKIYLKTTAQGSLDGWFFGSNTKLKINGQEVKFNRNPSDNIQQFSGTADLTMTPQVSGTTPDYKIIEGANGAWTQNSNSTLDFRANGNFSKFTGVKVDSKAVSSDKYTVVSGSTVITFKNDYLATLSVGKHTLSVIYIDGECSTEFEIKSAVSHDHNYSTEWKHDGANHWHECACGDKMDKAAHTLKWVIDKKATTTEKGSRHQKCSVCGYKKTAVDIPAISSTTKSTDQTNKSDNANSPKTGDTSNMILWIALLFVSGGVAIGTTVLNKKKKYNR